MSPPPNQNPEQTARENIEAGLASFRAVAGTLVAEEV